ncbi:TetR family transcriptional regulator, partial [Kitasatospora sp. NPDC001574]
MPSPTRRERLRAETLDEIKAVALRQLREVGAAQLSLRTVATDLGMSPAGLYRYFDNRDALLTTLITDSFDRLGRSVLVHDTEAYREALTRIPLDRTAPGTTGGAAARLTDGGLLFDQDGAEHRSARRVLAGGLDSAAVRRLRPHWLAVLAGRVPAIADGPIDLVRLAQELSGVTAAALTVNRDIQWAAQRAI